MHAETDIIVDIDERSIFLDAPEQDGLALDFEDRDFILDADDAGITANFGAVGLRGVQGESAYALWLAAGNEGTIDDFLDTLGGITAEELNAALSTKADIHNPTLTGLAQLENLAVSGNTTALLDGGFF